jgi:integrase
MASLQRKNESYYCQFIFHGKRHTITIGKVGADEAVAFAGNVDYLLLRLRQGLLRLPPAVHIVDFIRHNGKVPSETEAPVADLSFDTFRTRYLEVHSHGALEGNSLATIKMHLRHLERSLGSQFIIGRLTQADLQRHINRRAASTGAGGQPLSPVTIRKEIASLRAAWNWGILAGLLRGAFPNKGLAFPKMDEKPPFQTREEIERQILRGGLEHSEIQQLWDCLFLTRSEIEEVLDRIRSHSAQPFLYPMVCMAAHTGARRSELLRARIADIDLVTGIALIREKKRVRGTRTTRRVPLTPFLATVLRAWLEEDHPGGPMLFAQRQRVAHSRTRRTQPTPITRDEAHDHLRRALGNSRWQFFRGWHTFRHSFISNCAAGGIDQRVLDQWVGHTTDVRRRYIHLIPGDEQQAIRTVFGVDTTSERRTEKVAASTARASGSCARRD